METFTVALKFLSSIFLLLLAGMQNQYQVQGRLSVKGTDFHYNNQKVFLSGVSVAWVNYGNDFGNNRYDNFTAPITTQWLSEIAKSGGNSISVWVHAEGLNTPLFDTNGIVIGTDAAGTLIADLGKFLDVAKANNLLVNLCLWAASSMQSDNYAALYQDDLKLQSYLDNVLKPMVKALSQHPAMGTWEILLEPEGSVLLNQVSEEPCFDTQLLAPTDAGWTGRNIPMSQFQRFINWHADAIHSVDPAALVTVSSWAETTQTDAFPNTRYYYSDACLTKAGQRPLGVLNFRKIHSYSIGNKYESTAPMKVKASDYLSDRPVLIGGFSARLSEGNSINELYNYFYNNGYAGAWGFQYNGQGDYSDPAGSQLQALKQLAESENAANGIIHFTLDQ